MSAMSWILYFPVIVVTVEGSCGFPGKPQHGDFFISYNFPEQVANYSCLVEVIDGDLSRRCDKSGRWTGVMPRCAIDVSLDASVKFVGDTPARKLNDRNLETCDWFSEYSFKFESERKLHVKSVAVVAPIPYSETLKSSKWILQVIDTAKISEHTNQTFHETENSLANDQFSSVRWHLNDIGNAIVLKLQDDNVYLCEIFIDLYPDECGVPEVPVHGQINVTRSQASYSCDSGFKLSGNALRNCSEGLWTGDQPICSLPDLTNSFLNAGVKKFPHLSVLTALLIHLIVAQ